MIGHLAIRRCRPDLRAEALGIEDGETCYELKIP